MKRQIGSVLSAVALLSVVSAAAATNVKMLHGNQAATSVLNVQEAGAASTLANPAASQPAVSTPQSAASAEPTVATQPAASAEPTVAAQPTQAAVAAPTEAPAKSSSATTSVKKPAAKVGAVAGSGTGKQVVGSVGGGAHGDDGEDDDDGPSGRFVQLTPAQMSLLRVAALAQVKPKQARDAAKGIGSTKVINRVKAAAAQVSVSLEELAAIVDIPSDRGRRHGGGDEDHEGEDDD